MSIHGLKQKEYEEFLALRKAAFYDDDKYITSMNDAYGMDIKSYVLTEEGKVQSALTQFKMGSLILPDKSEVTASISYGICTEESSRGKGYGSKITEHAKDYALSNKAASILTPANEGLIKFYEALGYESFFYTESQEAIARNFTSSAFCMENIDIPDYRIFREKFLQDRVHIKVSEKTMNFVKKQSLDSNGLYRLSLNGRTAICVCEEKTADKWLVISELLVDPSYQLNPADFAAGLADALGLQACKFKTPASCTSETKDLEAMIAFDHEKLKVKPGCADGLLNAPYFAFPFE